MDLRPTVGRAAAALVACALTAPVALPSAAAAVRPEVDWSDRNVVAGATSKAVVKKSTRPTGATLILERRNLDTWRTADRTAERTEKGYVLRVPTDQVGSFDFRVVAKRDGNVVSRSGSSTVTVRPPYDPVGKRRQHEFAAKPRVRWDSCQKIRWTFNPRKAPKRGLKQVRAGFRRIHLATGLEFAYKGRTDQKPNPYGNKVQGADVIIGWRTAKDYKVFSRNPGTVGIGGNRYYAGYQEADGSPVSKAVQGGVVLNASMRDKLKNGYGKGATWGEVIIHELGHLVGLSHTSAGSQIMYYSVIRRNANWGAGDLAGFRRLGDVRGCLEKTSGRRAHSSEKFLMH